MNDTKSLTESMFYVLMALYRQSTFGIEIVEFIRSTTNNRILMGPGTLYTILSKFENEGLIVEIAVDGRKRTYQITAYGIKIFESEMKRLEEMLSSAKLIRSEKHEKKD